MTAVEESVNSVGPRRPASLSWVCTLALVGCGVCYLWAAFWLSQGSEMTWGRLIWEPLESKGGVPFPGWEKMGAGLRGESGWVECIAAEYWWEKIKMQGSMLAGPVLLVGLVGVLAGRTWGRNVLYVYLATWVADKVLYMFLFRAAGVPKFALAIGMAVAIVLVLRCESWSAWIEGRPPELPSGDGNPAAPEGVLSQK